MLVFNFTSSFYYNLENPKKKRESFFLYYYCRFYYFSVIWSKATTQSRNKIFLLTFSMRSNILKIYQGFLRIFLFDIFDSSLSFIRQEQTCLGIKNDIHYSYELLRSKNFD